MDSDFKEHAGSGTAEVEAWRAQALEFLEGTPIEEDKAIAKQHRKSAYAFLCALHNALSAVVPKGLLAFEPRGDPAGIGEKPQETGAGDSTGDNILSLTIDQGSVGWAASQFLLRHESYNLLLLADPNHRSWNDVCASLKLSKLWPVVLMSKVLFDTNIGPWDGAKWWEELKEGCVSFVGVAGPDDPLMARYLPGILDDLGLDHTSASFADATQVLLDIMGDVTFLCSKGSRVSMNRWMNWLSKAEEELRLARAIRATLRVSGMPAVAAQPCKLVARCSDVRWW